MRLLIAIALAAYAAAAPQLITPDPGADADDSWEIGEIAETATLIVDRISEARKFLADMDDDEFDFQEWYDEQLQDFQADQDNVAYKSQADKDEDLQDFRQMLNAISTEFAASQGEDYANFVRDIIGEGIDHLHDQASELLARMRETAQDINDLEEQEFDLYVQLAKISCVSPGPNGIKDGNLLQVGSDWPKEVDYSTPTAVTVPGNIADRSTCYLASLAEEFNEAVDKFGAAPTSTGKNKQRRKLQKYAKQWRDYVRKWRKLAKTYKNVDLKEKHEREEYDKYEFLLKAAQELQEFGLAGSDALVLDDGRFGNLNL